jgi:hypothetical protein
MSVLVIVGTEYQDLSSDDWAPLSPLTAPVEVISKP